MPHGTARPAVLAACVGLAVYLAAFFLVPMAGSGKAARPELLFASLLRPDDFLRQWFAGFTWQSVVERGRILVIAAAVLCVALAAGWTCLRLLRVDRAVTRLEMSLFSLGVGLNVVSLATLALGLLGALRLRRFAGTALVLCIVAAIVYFRGGCAVGHMRGRRIPPSPATAPTTTLRWSSRWLWLGLPFVVAIVLSAMLPPFDFDVREYHLQAPKEFYRPDGSRFCRTTCMPTCRWAAEMLGLAGMVVSGDWWIGALVGKTLIALFVPLTALGVVCGRAPFRLADGRDRGGAGIHFDSLGGDGLLGRAGRGGVWLLSVGGLLRRVDVARVVAQTRPVTRCRPAP